MRTLARPATLLLVLALGTGSVASAQRGGGQANRFQRPTEERRIQAPGDAEQAPIETSEAPPENMEDALYLRERADNLGEAARDFHNELLTRLLAEREQWVVRRRQDAIRLLEEFIGEEPENAPEMADALLRLSELLWERARGEYLMAFAAWQEVPEANRGPQPRPEYRRPMELYDRILRHHRGFDRYDFVLYMKAYAFIELDRADDALGLYRQILEEFPESRFVPDAHMALAESHFSGSYDYTAALAEYEKVLEYPGSGLYDVALFKSAWCLWRMGRNQDAALRFRQVLDLEQRRGELTAQQRRRLRELQEEALEYLIQVFIEDETNTAADVFAFLEDIGGERYANRVLSKLSETYFGQSRYEQGIDAYELLLERMANHPQAPQWQAQVAAGWAAMQREQETIESLRKLAFNYGPGTEWASNQVDSDVVDRAGRLGERSLRRQALMWHEEGQRESQNRKLENAAHLYGVYLERYRRSRASYRIYFYRAEILFHRLERFSDAGDDYLAAARKNPQGELTRDALYNAIGAYERVREEELQSCVRAGSEGADRRGGSADEAAEGEATEADSEAPEAGAEEAEATEEGGERRRGAEGPAICGESDNDRKFSEAIELYVELFPNDPDLPEILFRQGRLYYDREIYDPAVRLFGQLIARYPNSEFAEPAGTLILDSFNRAQDYQNIERWARRLKEAPAFSSNENQTRLNGLILQAVFKAGEQLAERGQHEEAAAAYLRAADEFPSDDRARQAYFNAGTERQRAGDLSGAAAAYDRLIELHPGSREGALGCWASAQAYESIAQFSDAARYYETYVERFPEGPKVQDAAYNAVLLRVTAGDNEAAVSDGRRLLDRFPRHQSADEVTFFIGRAHEAAESWDDAAQVYRGFIRRTRNLDLKVEATTRLARVLLRDGNRRAALRALDDAVRLGRRNAARLDAGMYYAAQARYMQGERVIARYESVQIAGDMAGLRDRLQRKAELLREAALIFADVVEFQVAEWVTAALFQIGRSYELFAEGLRAQPPPEGLGEAEEQSYHDQLAMFIIPMEDQALQAYEGGYQKALELRIFNRWTARLFEALTRLNDVQYPPLREMGTRIISGAPLPLPQPLDGLRRGGGEEEEEQEAPGASGGAEAEAESRSGSEAGEPAPRRRPRRRRPRRRR